MRFAAAALATGLATGLVAAAVGSAHTANRLDRLRVRTDAAWAALDTALRRRALVVSRLAGCLTSASDGRLEGAALREVAAAVLRVDPTVREEAENELCRMLAKLDRGGINQNCAARLTDAEQRVVIARRVYNDAVRDTVALRSRITVRWLRLASTAPLPSYFEIAEPLLPVEPAPDRSPAQDGAGA